MLTTRLCLQCPRNGWYGLRLIRNVRFKSSESDKSKKIVKKTGSEEISSFKIKSSTSSSSPAPIDGNIAVETLMKKDNKPYIPKMKHERVTYEYPGLPNVDDTNPNGNNRKPTTRWTRYIPKILTVIVGLWGVYTVKVWVFPSDENEKSHDLLAPHEFHTFIITHKQKIDNDHYLIELAPKYKHWQYSYYAHYDQKSIWNGDRIWSVDIKHPHIMVVRSYTPLPLYFMKSEYTRSGEKEPLLKVINNDANDYDKGGVMSLYIKRYGDAEVSRYITNKEVGDELELRGPNIEYKFPYHPIKKFHERPIFKDLPSKVESEMGVDKIYQRNNLPAYDNLNFYSAGTGIAPILQVLFSKNPYRGFVNLHYSAQKPGEIEPFERFLFFLEKLDRIKFIPHYDSVKRTILSDKDFTKPAPSEYLSPQRIEETQSKLSPEDSLKLRLKILKDEDTQIENEVHSNNRGPRFENALEQARETSKIPKKDASLSIVCGPDGFIDYVAGAKLDAINEQGKVGGKLGEKNWDNTNTFKL